MTKEYIIKEIRRTATENGGKPLGRLRFFKETGIKESDWSGKYWARWNDVLREAGFGPNILQQPYQDKHLLDKLAILTRELGRVPVASEMRLKTRNDASFPNSKTYFNRFGNKQNLLVHLYQHIRKNAEFKDLITIIDEELITPVIDEQPKKLKEEVFGFVYLLKSGRYYKIGRSNAVERRERELAIQLPDKAVKVHVIRTDDPAGIEGYWHKRFASRRKNGEWFELTATDVAAFKRRKFM